MYLSPIIFNKLVRPKFSVEKYIKRVICSKFKFNESKVLDFGCGTGSSCLIFSPNNYLGIDIDKKRINFAKKLHCDYEFKVFDGNIIPAEDGIFDFICIFATIHHIPDRVFKRYIKEFKRVLGPLGRIVVIEPVLSDKNKFNNWFMGKFDEGEHIRNESKYLSFFENDFLVTIERRFRKFIFYNEIFFSAKKK